MGRGRLTNSQREQSPEAGRGEQSANRSRVLPSTNGKRAKAKRRVARLARGTALALTATAGQGRSEREKLRRANPKSGRQGKPWRRQQALDPSRASKRRRRNVLPGTSGQGACHRTRCRGQNLTKAAAIRKSRCDRFGPHSEGEPKPTRGSFMRETARTAAEAEHLRAGCRVTPDTTAEGSPKQYGDTHGGQDSERQATPREEGIAVGTLRVSSERLRSWSSSRPTPNGDKL
jgi:hypothetical protein